jgi:hypothetical protein
MGTSTETDAVQNSADDARKAACVDAADGAGSAACVVARGVPATAATGTTCP